jgi:hypothetical protein
VTFKLLDGVEFILPKLPGVIKGLKYQIAVSSVFFSPSQACPALWMVSEGRAFQEEEKNKMR